jgi:hypothetical protein
VQQNFQAISVFTFVKETEYCACCMFKYFTFVAHSTGIKIKYNQSMKQIAKIDLTELIPKQKAAT